MSEEDLSVLNPREQMKDSLIAKWKRPPNLVTLLQDLGPPDYVSDLNSPEYLDAKANNVKVALVVQYVYRTSDDGWEDRLFFVISESGNVISIRDIVD